MASGWDKPLEVRWKFFLPELISAIKQQIDRSFKNPSGKLRASFSLSNIHTIKEAGREGVEITNDLPYAQIQNYGGHIPDRVPVRAKVLHWVGPGGEDVFAKRARGFDIQGKNYVEKGIFDWMSNPGSIDVDWS